MSIFYCDYHDEVEDSDYVGFEVTADGREVCDDGLFEIEEAIEDVEAGIISVNSIVRLVDFPEDSRNAFGRVDAIRPNIHTGEPEFLIKNINQPFQGTISNWMGFWEIAVKGEY